MHILFSLSRRYKKQSLKRHGDLKTDGQLDSTPHQPYIFPYSFIFLKRTKSLGCFRKSITLCSIKIFGLCPLASGVFGTKRSLFLESLEIIQIGLSAACLWTLSKNAMITADSPVTCEIYDKLENHLVSWEQIRFTKAFLIALTLTYILVFSMIRCQKQKSAMLVPFLSSSQCVLYSVKQF